MRLSISHISNNIIKRIYQRHTKTYCSKNNIFDYKIDKTRAYNVIKQLKMHGGLNELLVQYGYCPLSNCKQAIEKTFELGIINFQTYKKCIEINKKSNQAKHSWMDEKK